MTHYSAFDAISPAIERTNQFLFQPFRVGRFLKLTLVAILTEGGMASCNFHAPGGQQSSGGSANPFPISVSDLFSPAHIVILAAIALLIVIPVTIVISYLLIRLSFSFFECVLYRQDRIAPAWSRYHRQAMRMLGLRIGLGLLGWLILIAVGYALYDHFKPLFQSLTAGGHPDFTEFIPIIAIAVPVVLVLALFSFLIELTLGNFVLPRMALEDASIQASVATVWDDVQQEPGQFILFVFLRAVLSIVAAILGFLIMLVPILVLGGLVAALVLIVKASSTGLALALAIPAGLLAFAVLLVLGIGVGGTIGTFKRNYSILFYAGRYPDLAAILWPAPAQPAWESGIAPTGPQGTAI